MSSFKTVLAPFIILVLAAPAFGQTKVAPQPKPAPSRQAVAPPASFPPANAAPVSSSSMPIQNTAAATSPQLPTARSASGTVVVEYRKGLLSLMAERAELGQVLKIVGSKIGTSIEVAPDITADPVVAHISPAPPSQVLAQLLDGPQLEYIVMGSDESGHVLNRVVVRKRNGFARQPLVAIKSQASGAAK